MSDFKWTERVVATAVAHSFDVRVNIVLPNYSNGLTRSGHESDLVVVRPSGWAEEIEIKISQSDYRAEFRAKPLRHRILQEGLPTNVYAPKYWQSDSISQEDWAELLAQTHVEIASEFRGRVEWVRDWSKTNPHMCRRFWFAMPSELAEKLEPEVPTYAGILSLHAGHYGVSARKLRAAPILKHSQKVDPKTRAHIMQCAYHRYWDTRPLSEKQTA